MPCAEAASPPPRRSAGRARGRPQPRSRCVSVVPGSWALWPCCAFPTPCIKGKDPALGSGLTGESCGCLFSGLGAGQGLCCCSAGCKRYPPARASLGPELGIPGRRSPVLQRSCRRAACELGSRACRIRLPLGPTRLCLHEGSPGDSFGTPGVSGEGGNGGRGAAIPLCCGKGARVTPVLGPSLAARRFQVCVGLGLGLVGLYSWKPRAAALWFANVSKLRLQIASLGTGGAVQKRSRCSWLVFGWRAAPWLGTAGDGRAWLLVAPVPSLLWLWALLPAGR